jgi:hypothetical protein
MHEYTQASLELEHNAIVVTMAHSNVRFGTGGRKDTKGQQCP